MSEYPPKKLDLDLTEDETVEKPLDLDLSNETATTKSLDAAESAAKLEAVEAYLKENRRKVAEAVAQQEEQDAAKQALKERLAKLAGRNADELFVQSGQPKSNVLEFTQKAPAQESNPLTAESFDIEAVRAAQKAEQEQKEKDAAEIMALREELQQRKAA